MRLIHGSAHRIPDLADGSVQAIVTSPPYWSLRKYSGEQDIEWPAVSYAPMPGLPELHIPGCDPACEHEWGDSIQGRTAGGGNAGMSERLAEWEAMNRGTQIGERHALKNEGQGGQKITQGAYCRKCGGWRGALGLEPDINAYIGHLILCLREWRRILRDDGTCWVNLGDSYNGNGAGGGGNRKGNEHGQHDAFVASGRPIASGLKPKDLCGVPWRVAFAAQADGWFLRSDLIWAKLNPMPESVTDRPTRSHEYIFLLSKSSRYYYDVDAVREAYNPNSLGRYKYEFGHGQAAVIAKSPAVGDGNGHHTDPNPAGRNLRSVWTIPTQGFSAAHFATFPEAIPERCIRAGTSAKGACPKCGAPWVRNIQREAHYEKRQDRGQPNGKGPQVDSSGWRPATVTDNGWQPSCTCAAGDPVPCVVMDPFAGSNTTGKVALRLGRQYVGVDLSQEYLTEITDARFANGVQVEMAL